MDGMEWVAFSSVAGGSPSGNKTSLPLAIHLVDSLGANSGDVAKPLEPIVPAVSRSSGVDQQQKSVERRSADFEVEASRHLRNLVRCPIHS
jgi:hypothetical protein